LDLKKSLTSPPVDVAYTTPSSPIAVTKATTSSSARSSTSTKQSPTLQKKQPTTVKSKQIGELNINYQRQIGREVLREGQKTVGTILHENL
jgi:hypothetical protein